MSKLTFPTRKCAELHLVPCDPVEAAQREAQHLLRSVIAFYEDMIDDDCFAFIESNPAPDEIEARHTGFFLDEDLTDAELDAVLDRITNRVYPQ